MIIPTWVYGKGMPAPLPILREENYGSHNYVPMQQGKS